MQIWTGLLEPLELLLIDEITVDLSVLMRVQLLDFLSTGALSPRLKVERHFSVAPT